MCFGASTNGRWSRDCELKELQQNVCLTSSRQQKKQSRLNVSWTERTAGSWSWLFVEGHHWWQKFVLRLRPEREAVIKLMETFNVTTPPPHNAPSECTCQDDAELFHRCEMNCSHRTCSSGSACWTDILFDSSEPFARCDETKTSWFVPKL